MYRIDTPAETFIAPDAGAPVQGEPVAEPWTLARAAADDLADRPERPRVVKRYGCTCRRKSKSFVTAYAFPDGIRVLVEPQFFPRDHRDEVNTIRSEKPRLWPLHREPTGQPHLELTTCKHCKRHWVVQIDQSGFTVHRVLEVKFSVVVRD